MPRLKGARNMRKIKFNLKETMLEAERDEAANKPANKLISQDSIADLLKQSKPPVKDQR